MERQKKAMRCVQMRFNPYWDFKHYLCSLCLFTIEDDEDDMQYCKICLVTDCKMFSSPSISDAYSQLAQELCYYELYVCYECKHLLIKYQEFRSKCLTALKLLTSIQIDHSKVTKRFIEDIDRKHHKLESKLSRTSMVICNTNEQIVLPEPGLDSDIKTENDTHSDALEDDKSEINVSAGRFFDALEDEKSEIKVSAGRLFDALEDDKSEINVYAGGCSDALEDDKSEINVSAGRLFGALEDDKSEIIVSTGRLFDALEDDKSEINVSAGRLFGALEDDKSEINVSAGRLFDALEDDKSEINVSAGRLFDALEDDKSEINVSAGRLFDALEDDKSEINVSAGGLFSEAETQDTEYNNEILQPEHNLELGTKIRTNSNPGALESDIDDDDGDEIDGDLFSDLETQGKEYPNEIFQLNHEPNNIVTETKLKQQCIPNSKRTKESVPIKTETLKSNKEKFNLNAPAGYLSDKPSNYMIKLIQNYATIDKEKCLPSSKKTKEIVPKKNKTLKHIKKKQNSDNPLSCLSTKPSDYMTQLIQKYATIDIMTPSEAKKEIVLRKETDNYRINLHKCDLCYKGFASEFTYNNHMKLHSPGLGTEECEFCRRLFPKRRELMMHIKGSHTYKITCKFCPFVCYNLKQAKCHVGIHKGETYTCELCEMNFRYSHSLANHKRIKHPEHVCAHCGNMFASLMGLRSHKQRAHRQDSTELLGPKCEECNVQFATETAWKRHLVLSYKHTVSNGCVECGETFLTADELKSHAKEHPRRLAKAQYVKQQTLWSAVVCKLCNKRLETNTEYKKHMQSAHPNTKAANHIKERERRVEEDRQYICEVCGKVFRKRLQLSTHARGHAGARARAHAGAHARAHACARCGKRYAGASGLHTHNAIHHSGAPKFTCDICQKGFHMKCAIRKHIILVHLGVRPFKCDICNKRFPYRCEVRMHKEYVHFKKPWPKRDRTTCRAKRRNKDKETVE